MGIELFIDPFSHFKFRISNFLDFMRIAQQLKTAFLDLLFPRQCIGCKKADTWFCDGCFSFIKPNSIQVCYLCRKPSAHGHTCPSHQANSVTLDGLLVSAHYAANPMLKKAIHALKYHHHPEDIAEKLGQLLSKTLHSFFVLPFEFCIVLPIPLHLSRLKSRGYNQAQILLENMKKHLSYELPALSRAEPRDTNYNLLTRLKHTPSQVQSQTRSARLKNLENAFALHGTVDPEKTYLLIDDIATTGATLEQCCKLLKENGAKKVWGLVLARN